VGSCYVGFLLGLGLYLVGGLGLVALAAKDNALHDDFLYVFSCHIRKGLAGFYISDFTYEDVGAARTGLLFCYIEAPHYD